MTTATTNMKLISQISYRDGYIENLDDAGDIAVTKDECEIVESNLRGWGEATHVVRFDESFYLAVEQS